MQSPPPEIPRPRAGVLPLTPDREADLRAAVVAEALTWEGTRYWNLGDTKGAGVDCCMLLIRAWVDAGVVEPFDPRPYPPQWHLHRDEERYLNWLRLAAVEVDEPQVGDVVLWRFGRCFSHSAILVSPGVVIHALAEHGMVTRTSIDEAFLAFADRTGKTLRPRKFFDVFARIRAMEIAAA